MLHKLNILQYLALLVLSMKNQLDLVLELQ